MQVGLVVCMMPEFLRIHPCLVLELKFVHPIYFRRCSLSTEVLVLLVLYRDNGKLTAVQRNCNFVHAATRCTVARVFALLKGRFRRLKHLDMKHTEDVLNVIVTCCVLHNICLMIT